MVGSKKGHTKKCLNKATDFWPGFECDSVSDLYVSSIRDALSHDLVYYI